MCCVVVLMDAAMCGVFEELRMVKGPKPREGRVWVSRLSIGHATGKWRSLMQFGIYSYSFRGGRLHRRVGAPQFTLKRRPGNAELTSRYWGHIKGEGIFANRDMNSFSKGLAIQYPSSRSNFLWLDLIAIDRRMTCLKEQHKEM